MKNEDGLIERFRKIFVSKDIFELYLSKIDLRMNPMEKLVYGLVTVMLMGVIGVAGTAITFYMRLQK